MTTFLRGHNYTYQDYLGLPDDGMRYEVIFGELHMNPSPVVKHQRVSFTLASWLRNFQLAGAGEVFIAPVDVLFANDSVVVPDIVFVSAARSGIVEEKLIRGAPDLVVEVLSPSTRSADQLKKRRLYGRYGVREYWIVDPEAETLARYLQTPGDSAAVESITCLDQEKVYSGDDVLRSAILPDSALRVADLFS